MKNIKSYLLLVLLLSSFKSWSQLIHRDLLQKTPQQEVDRALIKQGSFRPFPQTAEGWRGILADSMVNHLIKMGEKAIDYNFNNIPATTALDYVRNGNRSNYEKLSFEKRAKLQDLVMAEAVEGKGRFSDQIVNGVWSVCEESFWGVSAHLGIQKAGAGLPDVQDPVVDLFSAETGSLLAWTDYLVGSQLDKVSKLVRPRIAHEIDRRIFTPMVTAKYGWMGGGNPEVRLNNWAPWIASNYIAANLLVQKDETKRAQAIHIAMKIVDQYIDGLGVDGGCEEGPSYWGAAGGCVFDALNLLYDGTGGKVNIYADPFIQKMGSYIYKTHIAGRYFINVADAHATLTPDALMIYRFGKDISSKPMMGFGSWAYHQLSSHDAGIQRFFRSRYLYNLLADKECAAYPAAENLSDNVWYSDVQLMASRTKNGLFLASHAGNNGESHNHNDVGDFIVYADGEPVIIDVGSGTYTSKTFSQYRYTIWFNTSAYHNLPLINGKEQADGTKYTAANVQFVNKGSGSALNMDIAKAYPASAGIKAWNRDVALKKNKGITVTDRYEMNADLNSISQTFMTVCDADISQSGKIIFKTSNGKNVYLDYDAALWDANKEKIQLTTPEDQGIKESWNGRDIWRITLTGKFHDRVRTIVYQIYK
ncbi:heparinase II/III-family protein [Mucilaginibacter sp. SMC90]|uniref:heparinase II/III domain-containing protein n=1 Tax=Mucilaginibacter sp. SMC90 TaxID=2929803 RepID=UPI001FB2DB8E|nr:heparinase II/III family protein [Mucilaginibacter sp. SMC90]UOE47242.1 heparinase II/III-family protein [Mucilaginibacter sp. SMC90]